MPPKAKAEAEKPAAKVAKKPAPKPSHPPYVDMIKAAISHLKERSGSSVPAIWKYIDANYDSVSKTHMSTALKKLVTAGKLVKIKASYRLGDALKAEPKPKKKAPVAKKPVIKVKVTKKATPKKTTVKKTTVKKTPTKKPVAKKTPTKPKKTGAITKKAAKPGVKKTAKPAAKKA